MLYRFICDDTITIDLSNAMIVQVDLSIEMICFDTAKPYTWRVHVHMNVRFVKDVS